MTTNASWGYTIVRGALLCACAISGLHAQVGDRAEIDRSVPPAEWQLPDGKVRTPTESLALFDVAAGFRVELVAAEPLVQDPIAIHFDEHGRLWVIEWPAYNWDLRKVIPGLEPMEPPKSRVVILEDADRDGRMDRRTVFLDGLEWPRGLQVMNDGALVINLPEIILARDRDGDGHSDERESIVTGLEIPRNPHGAQSNLFRAMDNWIYGSKFPRRLRFSAGAWVTEPYLNNRGQWGLAQDNFGRLVYASNGDHLRGDLVPGHYFTRNPNYSVTAGVDVRYAVDQHVWPHAPTPGVNRRAQLRDADGRLNVFTANTGPAVYRGDQFPAEYVGNVFLGEVAGRFIRRSVLTEADGMITARNVYPDREFLFSRDERFRPTFTTTGPDGALYVADMHRGIIEGDIFVTSFLRQQIIGRNLQQPFFGMGRIYRIVHSARPLGPRLRIARADSAGWVELLAHPNGFWRDTAQRILVEAGSRAALPALRRMAREHRNELARLHALWTIEGLVAVDPEIVVHAMRDPSPQMRIAALRLGEAFLSDNTVSAAALALRDDERVEVRRQWVLSISAANGADFERALGRFLRQEIERPMVVEAALSGLRDRELRFLGQLVIDPEWKNESPGAVTLFAALAEAVANSGNDASLQQLAEYLTGAAATPRWIRTAILEGLAKAKKPPSPLPAWLADLATSGDERVRTRALALKKAWSEPPGAASRRSLTGPVLERGQTIFAVCAACHGPEGKGQPGVAPPLEGSAVVGGTPEELLQSILLGRNLDRRNPAFPDMPPLAGLPDEDIAAVASYVRARWGTLPRAITIGQVRKARDETERALSIPSPDEPTRAVK